MNKQKLAELKKTYGFKTDITGMSDDEVFRFAQYEMSTIVGRGDGARPNPVRFPEGVRLMEYLADYKGHRSAQGRLGLLYLFGLDVKRDYEEAFLWCKKAANQGHKEAQRKLPSIMPMIVGDDFRKAVEGDESYKKLFATFDREEISGLAIAFLSLTKEFKEAGVIPDARMLQDFVKEFLAKQQAAAPQTPQA